MRLADSQLREQLLHIAKTALEQDQALRDEYNVGDKFKFIKERLTEIEDMLEEYFEDFVDDEEPQTDTQLAEDETLVYVHLFNVQGMILESWRNLLTPKLFYEYSINRPIFSSKEAIESYLRSKANKTQHAYLAVVIKSSAIMSDEGTYEGAVKIKEGALDMSQMKMFVHNAKEYRLNDRGELGLF